MIGITLSYPRSRLLNGAQLKQHVKREKKAPRHRKIKDV